MRKGTGILLIVLVLLSCQEKQTSTYSNTDTLSEKLDVYLERLIAEGTIPGISLAVFSPEKILYHRSLGVKDIETKQPVDSTTAFEAASLSKTVFAYLVLAAVEAGEIGLEQPLDSIVWVDLGLDDKRRGVVSPAMILAHRAGLPNWRSRFDFTAERYQDLFPAGKTLSFIDTPGKDFHYSGEGYLWLQRVLEKTRQVDLRDYANEQLFDPLGLTNTSFLFDERVQNNAARGYLGYRDTTQRLQFKVPVAAGSLHSNALEFSRFFQYLLQETKRSASIADMLQPKVVAEKKRDYTVHWGLGIGIIKYRGKSYLFHWGDNRIFKAYYLYSLEAEKGLVFFVNCQEGLRLQPDLVEIVFGEKIPMWPEGYVK